MNFAQVKAFAFVASAIFLLHCGASDANDTTTTDNGTGEELRGCSGKASSTIPASGKFELTSFGNTPSDNGIMACGEYTKDGSWYYAASRQRFGCGSHIKIQANGKCVVAETDDYGPDVCVENAAGIPIIDASPLVSEALFGTKSAGWSDHLYITVTQVATSTPLGPCAASSSSPDAGASGTGDDDDDDGSTN